MYLLTRSTTEQ